MYLVILSMEAFRLAQTRKKLRWRIAIAGTRGKSSVTRLIAGALREAGVRVIARTTGSRPVVIYPDGHEETIYRQALANILEGKRFLRLARRENAEAVVVELMAVQPECLRAEVKKIFHPHYLAFTNFRPDHVAELGQSREEVASNLLQAIFPAWKGLTVFLLEEETLPGMKETLEKNGAKVVVVSRRNGFDDHLLPKGIDETRNLEKKDFSVRQSSLKLEKDFSHKENSRELSLKDLRLNYGDDFADNIRLALVVTRFLGLRDEAAIAGMRKARPDFGSLKIWQVEAPGKAPGYAVSAFAANDPESSFLVLKKLKEIIPAEEKKVYGLLLFRPDRGDRTEQWLKAIANGLGSDLDGLFLTGCPYFSFVRVLRKMNKNRGQERRMNFFSARKDELQKEVIPAGEIGSFQAKESQTPETESAKNLRRKIEEREFDFEKTKTQRTKFLDIPPKEPRKQYASPDIRRIKPAEAKRLIEELGQRETRPWVLIGLGNIVGLGSELVNLWDQTGRRIHG